MRLDHLLSKELHRTPLVGCDRRGECPRPCLPVVEGPSTFPDSLWVGVWDRVARENVETPNSLRGGDSTLLGPERTTSPGFPGVVVSFWDGRGRLRLWGGVRPRFVWSLRIVQWTRASFVSVHICVVIS